MLAATDACCLNLQSDDQKIYSHWTAHFIGGGGVMEPKTAKPRPLVSGDRLIFRSALDPTVVLGYPDNLKQWDKAFPPWQASSWAAIKCQVDPFDSPDASPWVVTVRKTDRTD